MWRWLIVALLGCPSSTKTRTGVDGIDGASIFTLSVIDAPTALAAGETSAVRIHVERVLGNTDPIGAIAFSLAGAPQGISASGMLQAAETEGILTLAVAATTVGGDYTMQILGSSDGRAATVDFALRVSGNAPAGPTFHYAKNPAVYLEGSTIASNVPSSTVVISTYTADPPLPANLSLNPVSGIITGSATTVGTTDHLITAGTAAGNLTLTLRVVIDHLCEAECIEAPAQWLGPIALRADACGDTHPIAGAVAHSGLPQFNQANCMGTASWTPGAAQDNMCPTDPGGSCVTSNCNGGFQFRVDANAGCHAGPSQSGVDQWITLNYGDCTFSTSHTAEGVSFPDAFNVCAPSAVAGVCPDDKACQPALGSGRRCVYQHGNVASCPSAYPTRVPLYTGYTDTRGCTPAGCSYTAGTCTFTAYTGNSGCGGTPHTYDCGSFNYSICTGLGTFTGATLAQTGTPTLTGNAPTGTVAPSGVLTVCCAN